MFHAENKKAVLNVYRKTPGLESFFNKVTGPQACHFIEKSLQHGFFPVNNGKFFKNTCFEERLRTFASIHGTKHCQFKEIILNNIFKVLVREVKSTRQFIY